MASDQEITLAEVGPRVAGAISEDDFKAAVLTRLAELQRAVNDLHAYVARIEKEAHDSMAGLMSPDAMMDLAGKFLGGR